MTYHFLLQILKVHCQSHLIDLQSSEFPFYMMLITKLNQKSVTEFCKNSKVASSDFSMIKNIVALSSLSLPIKLICCFKSGFSNSICLLKSIVISLSCFEKYC